MIKEVIVVEGRDDITAVKRAVDAEVIAVGGFGINARIIERIKEAHKRQGVIVLTDPDFAGEKIRKIISKRIPDVKHAYISKSEGLKDGDIGVENASPEAIINALKEAKCQLKNKVETFTMADIIYCGLSGKEDSKEKRQKLGKILRIGYGNANQILTRLNNYGITKEEFLKALEKMDKENFYGK
ncbi:ribonuclease M5 [Clostridium malenominatum]|uniref:Ribonuclease M5 n=1 Tax=Clostridium malenominatum TaxID=1539 RepID=A0ABN1J502_9CLOT